MKVTSKSRTLTILTAHKARLASKLDDKPKEPLRPGDVIFHNNPVFVASGRPAVSPRSFRPTQDSQQLSTGTGQCRMFAGRHTQVRWVREYRRGHLYHHEGPMRPIEMFVMTKASLNRTYLPGLRRQVERCRKILAEGRAAVERDPSDVNSSNSDENSSTKKPTSKKSNAQLQSKKLDDGDDDSSSDDSSFLRQAEESSNTKPNWMEYTGHDDDNVCSSAEFRTQ